jgi:hypothetical protein
MKTYYVTTTGSTNAHSDTWGAAKRLAAAALKSSLFPVEIEQLTSIDGRSPHRRTHVLIEDADGVLPLEKRDDRWECIDSFYSHVKPSIKL